MTNKTTNILYDVISENDGQCQRIEVFIGGVVALDSMVCFNWGLLNRKKRWKLLVLLFVWWCSWFWLFESLIGYMWIQWWWWRYDKSRLNSCNFSNFLWAVSELFLFYMFLCTISLVWCFISLFEPNVFTKNLKFYMNLILFTGLKELFLKLALAEVSL